MAQYVAFLRGINVSGRRIANEELRSRFLEMGFGAVTTFRASGNVIFETDQARASEIAAQIEEGLASSLGYDVPTFLRSAAQVRAIAKYQPFEPKLVAASNGRLQVAMLAAQPSRRKRDEVLSLATHEDELSLHDREFYWLPSGGTLDSGLDLKQISKILGTWTMRTKATVEQIAAKFSDA